MLLESAPNPDRVRTLYRFGHDFYQISKKNVPLKLPSLWYVASLPLSPGIFGVLGEFWLVINGEVKTLSFPPIWTRTVRNDKTVSETQEISRKYLVRKVPKTSSQAPLSDHCYHWILAYLKYHFSFLLLGFKEERAFSLFARWSRWFTKGVIYLGLSGAGFWQPPRFIFVYEFAKQHGNWRTCVLAKRYVSLLKKKYWPSYHSW